MLELVFEAIKGSFEFLPYLFLIYVLIEIFENARSKAKIERALAGPYAPIVGAASGLVPECGFSIMSAKLFDKGFIQMGTLIAVFLATSDEGIIVLISGGAPILDIVNLVLWKFAWATLIGTLLNIFISKLDNPRKATQNGECSECGASHESGFEKFVIHPFCHAATTFLIIIVEEVVLALLIYFIGENNLYAFVNKNVIFQPLVASVVGLIPTCASSIIISQSYLNGILGFSGLLAGLSTNAGLGVMMLVKSRRSYKKAIYVFLILYLAGVSAGYLSMLLGF